MCGIAGFINLNGHHQHPATLLGMLSRIGHRGPDATGVYIDDHAALGHVRLSIIDLAGGDQPIHNEDRTVWVSYNGEIYNYPELRADLEKQGHCFYTTTDTEVLVHLYEEYGASFLPKLNGQWAFALWDSGKQRLFLSRDRVGVRPVFYTHVNGTFIFASEIKALFAFPGIERTLDSEALAQVFTFWTTLPGKTMFRNIHELPPGNWCNVERGSVSIQKYWDIPLYSRDRWLTDPPDRIGEQVRELLVDAVRIRLRADVPVGTYLSGGLDSSAITAIVAERFNPAVQTFGIRFGDERFDEGAHQNEMVRYLNVTHHEVHASDQAIGDAFAETVFHCEKPLLRTAPVPLYLLARLVRESGIKVVLTGEGADEFHGGYDIFKEALVRRFWGRRKGSQCRGRLVERIYPDIFRDNRTRKAVAGFFGRDLGLLDDPLFSHLLRWKNTGRIRTFFSNDIKSALAGYDAVADCRSRLPGDLSALHTLLKAQYLEISIFLSNYLLSSQGDRMGMAHSVEVRMPFLDHRLMDLTGRMPPWWKICGLHEKHLLKKAVQPFLPPSITARVKHPYRAPVHSSLLLLAASESGAALLSKQAVASAGLFDVKMVDTLLDKLARSEFASETDAMALAGILSTQVLHREFIVKNGAGSPLPASRPALFVDKRSPATG